MTVFLGEVEEEGAQDVAEGAKCEAGKAGVAIAVAEVLPAVAKLIMTQQLLTCRDLWAGVRLTLFVVFDAMCFASRLISVSRNESIGKPSSAAPASSYDGRQHQAYTCDTCIPYGRNAIASSVTFQLKVSCHVQRPVLQSVPQLYKFVTYLMTSETHQCLRSAWMEEMLAGMWKPHTRPHPPQVEGPEAGAVLTCNLPGAEGSVKEAEVAAEAEVILAGVGEIGAEAPQGVHGTSLSRCFSDNMMLQRDMSARGVSLLPEHVLPVCHCEAVNCSWSREAC